MSDFSMEVGAHSEEITVHLILKEDCFISFTAKYNKLNNEGGLFLAYEPPPYQTQHFHKIWDYKTKIMTWKFLAGYEPESLANDLFGFSNKVDGMGLSSLGAIVEGAIVLATGPDFGCVLFEQKERE